MNKFDTLLSKLDFKFKNLQILETAFTHRSYLNESENKKVSNERLEFLGDAILSFLMSTYLYQTYPDKPEGILTNLRSSVVKTETLADIAKSMNLGEYLYLSKGEEKGGGRENISLLADTFEALIAAVYLDQGIDKTNEFLHKFLFPKIPQILSEQLYTDYKSKLQEHVQTNSAEPPVYQVIKTEGPDHAKKFWVRVIVNNQPYETGTGKSKQEAEQNSAKLTLEKMGQI